MCKSISKFLILFFLVFATNYAYSQDEPNKITICNDCTSSEVSQAAKSQLNWNQTGIVYVMDFYQNKLSKLYVSIKYIIEGNDSWPTQEVTELQLNANDVTAKTELNGLLSLLQNDINSYGMSAFASKGTKPITIGQIPVQPGTIDFYRFLADNTLHKTAFDDLIKHAPIQVITSFNRLTDLINLGAIHLNKLKIGIKIVFPSGHFVIVVPDYFSEKLELIPGSAGDSNGNTYPLPGASLNGFYNFYSLDAMSEFASYLNNFFNDVRFIMPTTSKCRVYVTTCSTVGKGDTVCSLQQCVL